MTNFENADLYLNGIFALRPCATPSGQPVAEQNHPRSCSLKNLTLDGGHGCTAWRVSEDADSGPVENNSNASFGYTGQPARCLSNLLRRQDVGKGRELHRIFQELQSFIQYPG